MMTAQTFNSLFSRRVKGDNITVSGAKFGGVKSTKELFGTFKVDHIRPAASRWKTWSWDPISAGECTMTEANLMVSDDGNLAFSCSLKRNWKR